MAAEKDLAGEGEREAARVEKENGRTVRREPEVVTSSREKPKVQPQVAYPGRLATVVRRRRNQ